MIYFFENTISENIKIGHASCVLYRQERLEAVGGYPLELLGVIRGGESGEKKLHYRFRDLRVKGEWFRFHPKLMSFIREFARPLVKPVESWDCVPEELTIDDVIVLTGVIPETAQRWLKRYPNPLKHVVLTYDQKGKYSNNYGVDILIQKPDLIKFMARLKPKSHRIPKGVALWDTLPSAEPDRRIFRASQEKEGEIWKPIPGFDGYGVSNLGRVKSVRKFNNPHFLKPFVSEKGHLRVILRANNRSYFKGIHQLVMLAFVGPCPEGELVCHKDSDPSNNKLNNLRYDTHRGNMQDRVKRRETLTPEQVNSIREDYVINNITVSGLARKYNISGHDVNSLLWGKTYRDIEGEVIPTISVTERMKQRARLIRIDYATGQGDLNQLAEKYGINKKTVSCLINGHHHADAGGPIKQK